MAKSRTIYFRELNNMLDYWADKRYSPNVVRKIEDALSNFYRNERKKPVHADRFSPRVRLSDEALEELYSLGDTFMEELQELEDRYSSLYSKFKNVYGWESEEDAIRWSDRMASYKNDALLREILSSEQIQELYSTGSTAGLSDEDIEEMIYIDYSASGATGDRLYNKVLGGIRTYDEGLEGWE